MDRFIYRENREKEKAKGNTSFRRLFNNFLTKVILLTISAFLLYNIGHSIHITIQKVEILRGARLDVDKLRLENLELALLLENMESKEYLEIQARNRLNFAGESEYIFVIPESVLEEAGKDIEVILGLNQEQEEVKVYEQWQEFLLNGI